MDTTLKFIKIVGDDEANKENAGWRTIDKSIAGLRNALMEAIKMLEGMK